VHSSLNAFIDAGSGDTPHGLDVVVVTDGGDGAHHKLHRALRVQVRPIRTCQDTACFVEGFKKDFVPIGSSERCESRCSLLGPGIENVCYGQSYIITEYDLPIEVQFHGALRVQVRPVGSCQCEQLVLRLMYDAQPSHRYGLLRINGWQGDQQDCRLWPAAIAKALWRAARLLSLLVCRQDVSDWKMHSAPSQAHGLHPWTAAGGHYHYTIDSPTAGVGVPPGRLREVVLEDAQRVGRRAAGAAVQHRRHVDIYGVVGAVRAHLPH